jgi:hypothetical protein
MFLRHHHKVGSTSLRQPGRVAAGIAAALLAALCIVPVGLSPAHGQPLGPTSNGPGIWKNVQILPKNMPKAELKAMMKAMSKALGTDCDFCHKEPNMDAETDMKKTAREMMKMTTEINEKYRGALKKAKVTCFTCHHGAKRPEEPPAGK